MKVNLKKLKISSGTIPRKLAENTFLALFILFLAVFIFGGLVFYKYFILAQKAEPQITGTSLRFEKETFEKILQIWQQREESFKAADKAQYASPFSSATSTGKVKEK